MPEPLASAPEAADSPWPRIEVTADPEIEARVEALLEQLSLERKIGQIIQAEIKHVTPEDIRDYGLGSVLNGGGSFPGNDDRAPVADWVALSRSLHAAAQTTDEPRIPLIWGTDAVHGHNNVFGATIFPHNIGLGATRNAELVRSIAEATAAQVSATALDWNFAPTLAVSRDLRWGRAYESFSSDPDLVTELGREAVIGLQGVPGEGWLQPPYVVATAKHFVGDGGTFEGVDQGDTRLAEEELFELHGVPYPAAIEAGVQTVMASFSSWNGTKMHAHRYLLTEVLKERMGFDGFVIGDWNGHGQVPGCTVSDCLEAFNAGVDMFMVPEDWRAFYDNFLEHARNGDLSLARLDDAVRRILRVKLRAGLFDRPVPEGLEALPDPVAHAELARRAVRESLVLLKNNGATLPIDPSARILVVGDGADDIGKQSGGWTLDWQGSTGDNTRFPNGQSILDGLLAHATAAGGEVRQGLEAAADFSPDVVVAVIGENPYSEGVGDLESLEYQSGVRSDLGLLDELQSLEVPVVTVFISGRPLWVNPLLNRSDAFVAAWLPGTAGGGIADLLLSTDPAVDFSGRLSFAWPAEPLPGEDGQWPSLFPVGYGLTYAEGGTVDPLPEEAMAPLIGDMIPAEGDWLLFDGTPRPPWRVTVSGRNNSASPSIDLTDQRIQGDARRIVWTANSPGPVGLAAQPAVDFSAFVDDNAVLAYDLRLESPLVAGLTARFGCGHGCNGPSVDLTELVADRALGEWQALRVGLSCFFNENIQIEKTESIILLDSDGPLTASLANVRIERDAGGPVDLDCSP
ncbi:hypothetical protein AY599_05735 [Leptolyngbya valderiana BDU 20041]|nr:hypothetical protein AY599_05735 [Leptolyngbya valderiana BDU 20041]